MKYIVNVEGIILKDDKILLGKRSEKEEHAKGVWAFIGGKVEVTGNSDNTLEDTLVREIREEVGIEVAELTYLMSSSFISDMGKSVIDIVFSCTYQSGEPQPINPDETSAVGWFTTSQIENEILTNEWTKRVARRIIKTK